MPKPRNQPFGRMDTLKHYVRRILTLSRCISQVSRHLSKLFDNMAKLKFVDDADGNPTKEAVGMYSKEGEYVDFDKPCDCSGQVKI